MRKRMMQAMMVSALLATTAMPVRAEMLRVGGGGAAMSTIFETLGAPLEKATGIVLTRRPSTPANGLAELVGGTLDVAVAAVPLESMIAGATKLGTAVDRAKLQSEQIGTNRTVLLLHPSNKVAKLTKAQIKGIFTGKIVNWKEIGGDDSAIIVVWGAGTPGQNAQFIREVLDGEGATKEALGATNYANIREIVASTPEAVGIDPFGMVDDSVKGISSDPEMTSPIIAVTVGKPSATVRKMLDYVVGEGKKHTRQ